MIKKVGLSLLSLFIIFGFGVSFANPIDMSTNFRHHSSYCYKIKNPAINNYRVIIVNYINPSGWVGDEEWGVYEYDANECVRCSIYPMNGYRSEVYLLDKSLSIDSITEENIEDNAILIGGIGGYDYCSSLYDKIKTYEIIDNSGTYELVLSKTTIVKKLKQFPFFWLGAIIVETLFLFYIAKLFWEKNDKRDEIIEEKGGDKKEISNKKLLLFGIIPTTVTLPLLRFVLPSLISDGIWYVVIGEFLVVSIEAIILKYGLKSSWIKAIVASFICNFFSFIIISNQNSYDINYSPILLCILIEIITLPVIVKFLQRNEEISVKRLVIVSIFASIVSCVGVGCLIIGLLYGWWLGGIVSGLFIIFELFIIKYGFRISWKKSFIAFFISMISFIVVAFIQVLCFFSDKIFV